MAIDNPLDKQPTGLDRLTQVVAGMADDREIPRSTRWMILALKLERLSPALLQVVRAAENAYDCMHEAWPTRPATRYLREDIDALYAAIEETLK